MAGYLDSLSAYGTGVGGVGGVATPFLMGGGASNPTGAFLQSAAGGGSSPDWMQPMNVGSFPAAPNMSGGPAGIGANNTGLGFNAGTLGLALGGLNTIGNLWQAFESNKLAKQQFAFQKNFAMKNLANQIQTYNTSLEDKINSRYFTQGQSQDEANAYIQSHKLDDAKAPV
ncbi:hypothetical protein X766_15840 [Mesorhizobium sp. LSJC255A00]|uniref:hypothetical protein n=1 Tax=Mesorhizobium sp. LSJC255A00 TaxID=1287313 RepID=UPI0003CE7473|nr:hypothetical protein [Mesorhizobium sp. LSJC255A00]ESX17531.1 hypothetical protein X766_15840 [Mesorhizobium sp. LSJC255A00]